MAMNTGNVDLKAVGEKMNQWYPQAERPTPEQIHSAKMDFLARAQTPAPSPRLPSLLDEAEAEAKRHSEQANRQARAAAFFRAHPEFDEFIQLIRQGVIGI